MREYILIAPEFIFGDFMCKCSPQAILYYIKLLCNANKGFVSNPLEVLDSLGYDKSIYNELIANEHILTLDNRAEVFITAFYIHNRGLKYSETFKSYYWTYWKGKLWFKENGMGTRKRQESAVYDPSKDKRNVKEKVEGFDELVNGIVGDEGEEN